MTSDYYPFGLRMKARSSQAEGYRYGFQGQEEDKETGWVEYKYRMHNPSIGRFFAIDPLAPKYPFYSPYAFSGNRVIDMVELEGLEPAKPGQEVGETQQADGSTWGWTGDEWAHSDQGVTIESDRLTPKGDNWLVRMMNRGKSGLSNSLRLNSNLIPGKWTGYESAIEHSRQYMDDLHFVGYAASGVAAVPAIPAVISTSLPSLWANKGAMSFLYQYSAQSYYYYEQTGEFTFYNKVVLSRIDVFDVAMAQIIPMGGWGAGAKFRSIVVGSSLIDINWRDWDSDSGIENIDYPAIRVPLIGDFINGGVNSFREFAGRPPIINNGGWSTKPMSHVFSDMSFNFIGWSLGLNHSISPIIPEGYNAINPTIKSYMKKDILSP